MVACSGSRQSGALFTGIAFGVLPTFVLMRWGWNSTDASRCRDRPRAVASNGVQRALVAIEVALSLVMLVGCSLLGRSLVRLSEVDPGFTPNGLLMVQVTSTATPLGRQCGNRELS